MTKRTRGAVVKDARVTSMIERGTFDVEGKSYLYR
jgi:hypothetical protein